MATTYVSEGTVLDILGIDAAENAKPIWVYQIWHGEFVEERCYVGSLIQHTSVTNNAAVWNPRQKRYGTDAGRLIPETGKLNGIYKIPSVEGVVQSRGGRMIVWFKTRNYEGSKALFRNKCLERLEVLNTSVKRLNKTLAQLQ